MSWTSLFPRRKTIYLKILVLIPFSWMMITLLISLNGGGSNSSTPIQRLQQQHHNQHHSALSQNNPSVDGEEEGEREQIARAQNVMKISQIHGYQNSKRNNNNNNNNNYSKNNKRSRSDIDSNEVERERVKDQEEAAVLPLPRSSIHNGPGELGKAVHLPKNLSSSVQKLVDQGWSDNAFNQYVSDMISISRSLPDVRDPK